MRQLISGRAIVAAVGVLLSTSVTAQIGVGPSQVFPNRTVRLVVPLPPGTASDIRARQIAQKLNAEWQQPVIVENRPGATGNVAMEFAARAAPDGYTLIMANINSLAILPHLMKLPFDPIKDFAAVSNVTTAPLVLVAHPGVPYNSVAELIAFAKANPRKLDAASAGTGNVGHLALILFNKISGVNITHIPYKGGAQMIADLISGQVHMMFEFASAFSMHVKAGRVKSIAVANDKRLGVLPDIPTFEELGYKGMIVTGWTGIEVPAGTPAEIVRKLNTAVVRVLNLPDVREAIVGSGAEVGADSPEHFTAFIRAENEKWGKIISEAGIRLD